MIHITLVYATSAAEPREPYDYGNKCGNEIKKQKDTLSYYVTNILSLSDGKNTPVDIANKLNVSSNLIIKYVNQLVKERLVKIK